MRTTRKFWTSIGTTTAVALLGAAMTTAPVIAQTQAPAPTKAAEGGEGGEGGEGTRKSTLTFPDAEGKPSVAFSKALNKILGGEGGEGGIGYTKHGPAFEIPALSTEQLKETLVGRTVRKDQAVAMYFNPNGTVEGWKRDWIEADKSQCPTELGEDYEVEDGQCYVAVVNPIVGPYKFDNGRVCMPAYSGKKSDGTACYYFAFATKYIIIGDGKKMYGSGKELYPGRQLDVFLRRPFGRWKE
jgi:hypothetical protein